jgi:hypothetical protein
MSQTVDDHIILLLHVSDRVRHAQQLQAVLTEHGCSIKTRLGLHEASANTCSPNGIIVLETFGPSADVEEMETKLRAIEGLDCERVQFSHG